VITQVTEEQIAFANRQTDRLAAFSEVEAMAERMFEAAVVAVESTPNLRESPSSFDRRLALMEETAWSAADFWVKSRNERRARLDQELFDERVKLEEGTES
jgi:hypothetical protein